MKSLDQFVNWHFVQGPNDPKPRKVPFDADTGRNIDPHDSDEWMSYADAVATEARVGFVFTEADPYFFLDLDGCRDGAGWSAEAIALVARFPGAEVETSVSGKGLHVFGTYTGPRPAHGTRCAAIGGELYTAKRFVALGEQASGNPDLDCTAALTQLIEDHFQPRAAPTHAEWSDGPREGYTGPADDDELIRKALRSGSPFSNSVTFEQLWTRDVDALAEAYPTSSDVNEFDGSSADAALAKHLAFWTGCDAGRMIELMHQSELVRPKWERDDYLPNTVSFVIGSHEHIYDRVPNAPSPAPAAPSTDAPATIGYNYVTSLDQIKLFAGHIYVTSENKVMMPDGELLAERQFNVNVSTRTFGLGGQDDKTTRKAWEAFTSNQGYDCPIAKTVGFEPSQPWDRVLTIDGATYANTYRPIETPRMKGDPSRFLELISKMLPNGRDAGILIAYMAAVIQYKGVKFNWCPLIQGVPGNGKTLLTTMLQKAIGAGHSHKVQASNISSNFNRWLAGNILAIVEDVHVPEGKGDVMEVIKPMVTDSTMPVEAKGVDQTTMRVCVNFVMTSNHRDAIRKTRDDRRFAVFYTAQQTLDDLQTSGMGGNYFPDLWHWFEADGFAIAHDYLADYAIPDEINPATRCRRAPDTSSTDLAIEASRGRLEQEVIDLVACGTPGFRGGWVSRTILSDRLKEDRVRMSLSAQRDMLSGLGYIRHPAVPERTSRDVQPDGKRAELWVRRGHPAAQFSTIASAADAYTKANTAVCELAFSKGNT